MANENLNILFHLRRLTLIALNTYPTETKAAKELGITQRTINTYKKKFNILKNEDDGVYYIPEQKENAP